MRNIGKRIDGDTSWENEMVKEAVSRMKDVHKVMCWNSTEGNRNRHQNMKSNNEKTVSKAVREKAEEALTELRIVTMEHLDWQRIKN